MVWIRMLVFTVFPLVPIAAAVWALLTLYRIQASQQALSARLETIERLLHGGRQPG